MGCHQWHAVRGQNGGSERDAIETAIACFLRTKQRRYLKEAGLAGVPEAFVLIEMSRHMGGAVKPWEWRDVPLNWIDWVLISMAVTTGLATPPEVVSSN